METSEQIIDILFRRVWEILEREQKVFEEGKTMVDLSSLETQASELCETIAALPKEEGQKHQQQLQELIENLTRFATILQTQKEAIGEQLSALQQQSKAHSAYQTANATLPQTNDNKDED